MINLDILLQSFTDGYMSLVVKKFGGTSLADIGKIKHIARSIADDYSPEDKIVIVVSAMGDTTNKLLEMAESISSEPSDRELDMLMTAGERISMSLLALALHKHGLESISFTGSQSGIITCNNHGNAKILNVSAFRIREELNNKKIVIVAGFQGVSGLKEVTTLGRGGSDTTAVALACYLEADSCEIYTDVDGVYSVDPRQSEKAVKIDSIDSSVVLDMANCGAGVLHPRALEFAIQYKIPVEVKSSYTFKPGTHILHGVKMQEQKIVGISGKTDLEYYSFRIEENLNELLRELNKISVEESRYTSENGLEIIISKSIKNKLHRIAENYSLEFNENSFNLSLICVCGYRIKDDFDLLSELIHDLENVGIKISLFDRIQTGFRFFVDSKDYNTAVQLLHKKYIEDRYYGE